MLAQAPTLAPHMRILWGDGGHLLWLAGLLLYLATVFFSIFMSFRALLSHSLPASLEVQEHPLGPPPGPQWLPGRGSDAQGSLPGPELHFPGFSETIRHAGKSPDRSPSFQGNLTLFYWKLLALRLGFIVAFEQVVFFVRLLVWLVPDVLAAW
ncbi:uncharacterized protein LOC125098866 isoform X2 [Lutra lutra]|uniref:uncharacterized protein LOC125098866 isoform X2 n=1 Tax=Lutra lutra TaxID=9657 RepID=UPI001FD4392F|nr:uncharacterized protein LOC125098866 isoform X2 [Lutra lutra]